MNYWQAILKQTTDRDFMARLWRLALPVSLQSMMFSLLGLIDIMMVSQLGTTAVAAVGLGNRVFFFNLLVIAGLSGESLYWQPNITVAASWPGCAAPWRWRWSVPCW